LGEEPLLSSLNPTNGCALPVDGSTCLNPKFWTSLNLKSCIPSPKEPNAWRDDAPNIFALSEPLSPLKYFISDPPCLKKPDTPAGVYHFGLEVKPETKSSENL